MKPETSHIASVFGIFLLFSGMLLQAQQSNTFYLMHDIPQSNLLNPAVQIRCKYFVGIPVLASIHLNNSSTAFTYNDLAGGDTWNIEQVLQQMHRRTLITGEAGLNLVSLGYRHRSSYFTFNIAERVNYYQVIPLEMAEMAVHGNGPMVGETVRFNGFRPGGYHTREYALGLSRVISPYLTAGIRMKLLFGKANLSTGQSRLRVNTNDTNFGILMESDYTLNSSFPITITQDDEGTITGIELNEIDPMEYMMNRSNMGFGLDLGLIYRYNDELTLSASLLDLGVVRWKSELNNVQGKGNFIYEGTDLSLEFASRDFVSEIVDSILNTIDVTTTHDPYTYFLPTQIFLAGSYRYSEQISFGLVNRNVIYHSKFNSSFTLSAQAGLAEKITGILSWSYLNNSLLNIGTGIAWHANGIQFHAVTDNILGFFYPFDTRTLNIRAGFNLLLGCPESKKERLQEQSYGFLPRGGECPYPQKPEKKAKKRRKAIRKVNKI